MHQFQQNLLNFNEAVQNESFNYAEQLQAGAQVLSAGRDLLDDIIMADALVGEYGDDQGENLEMRKNLRNVLPNDHAIPDARVNEMLDDFLQNLQVPPLQDDVASRRSTDEIPFMP